MGGGEKDQGPAGQREPRGNDGDQSGPDAVAEGPLTEGRGHGATEGRNGHAVADGMDGRRHAAGDDGNGRGRNGADGLDGNRHAAQDHGYGNSHGRDGAADDNRDGDRHAAADGLDGNRSADGARDGDGAGGHSSAPTTRNGLGVGLLDPLPPRHDGPARQAHAQPQQQPGHTMVESHFSDAPPKLGHVRRSLDENKAILDAAMGVGTSFDIIYRELLFGEMRMAIYVVNGMFSAISNMVLLNMTKWLTDLGERHEEVPPVHNPVDALEVLFTTRLSYAQVTKTTDLNEAVFQVMSGPLVILVDGADHALVVDTREYPDRQPEEPTTERVIRGPHDGFVETLIYNTVLIRRRIRDPRLRFELEHAGVRGQMDVAVGYMEGLTDPSLVAEVRRRIKQITIDGIPAAEQAVSEYLTGGTWNPFPTVRFTERPDVAAVHLLEGHVIVICDTSPQAIIAPSTLWNHLQHIEDYHVGPFVGTYVRWAQYLGLFFATLLPPLWLAFAIDPRLVHLLPGLAFIGPKQPSSFPLGLQFVGAELTLDILRRAILNTPGSLSATMGILGAIVLGDLAAKSGIFAPEVLVYLVLAAIGQFAISSIELGMAARLMRFTLLIAVWALRLPGLLIGLLVWTLVLLGTRTFGIPYTWPLLPFDWTAFKGMLFREPITSRSPRPMALRVMDRTRQ